MGRHRQEIIAQGALALPIVGGQLAQTANGFVDTIMAGRVSANDLAGVAVGASIWVPLYLFMTGVLMSITPVLSRHLGGGALHRINPITQQGLWVGLGLGIISALILRQMAPVLSLMEVDPAIRPIVLGYLNALSWGMPAAAILLALRGYTEALGHTRPVLWISVIGLLINIPSNYVLIYGKLGFSPMGAVGCGWATTIVMWSMVVMMGLYIRLHHVYKRAPLTLRQRHLEPRNMLYLLKLGLPVGLSIFFEVSVFAIIALFIGSLGAEIVASHQVALNFTSLLFMVPLSFAIAATVRIGHGRGEGNQQQVIQSVKTALILSAIIGSIGALMLLIFRHQIPAIYTNDMDVRMLAAQLLLFAALYQVSDALQVCANGCLRGFEDTAWPMVMTLIAYWGIGLPVGYGLGLGGWWTAPMGPAGFWIGLIAGLSSAAVFLGARLMWRLKQPIPSRLSRD